MTWLPTLLSELPITVSDPSVWFSIGEGAAVRRGLPGVRHLARPHGRAARARCAGSGEILGVGLACGLMVLAAWWAAIWSAGRSSFTPVAVGFAVALLWPSRGGYAVGRSGT